jgi:predicted RNA-binding Zn ribbon-like protein
MSTRSERPTDHRGRFLPDAGWPPGRGAPGSLERVRRFLNTVNPESGGDHFETSTSLAHWLEREGYGRPVRVTATDRRRAVTVRQALRDLAYANHEGSTDRRAIAALDDAASRLPVTLRFGPPRLEPGQRGVDAALAAILVATYDSMVSGTWTRLKACRNAHCRWTFYDHSKNASGAWCSTLACGSRMKVRAYRARRRAGSDAAGHPAVESR